MGFLTRQSIAELKNYQYHGGEYSWFDNKMNVFWFWLTDRLPDWLAPNLITIVGSITMLSTIVIFMAFDTTF